jgi:ubiquitin C-terminal hydrolase
MHEDVNAISKKPYVEQKDSNGRDDAVVAAEFWHGFKQREKSIFVDIFYGQLKSRVQCSICKNISITFDPFNVLSVPIPKQSQSHTKVIEYYPLSYSKPVLKVKVNLSGENAKIDEIK